MNDFASLDLLWSVMLTLTYAIDVALLIDLNIFFFLFCLCVALKHFPSLFKAKLVSVMYFYRIMVNA